MADKQDYSVRIRRVADYEENEDNPVSHPVANLRAVLDSISKVGAARSGVASKGKRLLAGNLTKQAMLEMGIEEVIEITTNGKQWVVVNREDLTPEQEAYYSVADERSSEMAEWDAVQLAEIVNLLKDTPVDTRVLFDDNQIAQLLTQAADGMVGPTDPYEEWQGMPAFEQEDVFGAVATVKVHFASEKDLAEFARLMGQTVTMQTKFVWFPKQEKMNLKQYQAHEQP